MKTIVQRRLSTTNGILITLVLVTLLLAGCGGAQTKTGTLVGAKMSFSLDDAADQVIENMDFAGIVVLEMDDGTKVEAVCDQEIAAQLKGGQTLEIAPIENSEYWKVVRIVE